MGKCVSKHPSALTISLSEKDLATANQIWSKFAQSTEYIALKDEHGNQLCEYYYVSNKKKNQEQQQQQHDEDGADNKQQQQQQQHKQQKQKRKPGKTGKINKSGQWTAPKIEYDDDKNANNNNNSNKDVDDTTNHAADVAGHIAAEDLLLLNVGNITNNSHNDGQHCLAHLRLLLQHKQQHELAAADSNNTADGVLLDGVKKSKNPNNKRRKAKTNAAVTNHVEAEAVSAVQKSYWRNCACEPNLATFLDRPRHHLHDGGNFINVPMNDEGQTESKKNAKKNGNGAVETKGTAMSFGFRKKLNTTPKKLKKLIEGSGDTKHKKQDKCNNISDGYDEIGTVIDTANMEGDVRDDNGNTEAMTKVHFEKVGAAAGSKSTHKTSEAMAGVKGVPPPEQEHTNRPGAGNRFGYRGGNIVRPASTGIVARYQSEAHDNLENNNCSVGERSGGGNGGQQPVGGLVSNLKRRSKSAHAGRALTSNESADDESTTAQAPPKITQPKTITFNLNQNSTIEYRRQQFFQQPSGNPSGRVAAVHQPSAVNTGMHTNVIVRPTPRAPPATFSKFTLHTVSLPKPEFPVAISLNAVTPTTPGPIFSPSTLTGARAKDLTVATATTTQHPLTTVAQTQHHMDLKNAKQMANNTRRGFSGPREISADSGIASMDMALDSSTSSGAGGGCYSAGRTASPKRSRSRPRNLQMVMSGRHKFEVRDLDNDPLSSESSSIVETLALPKLPSENQTIPLPLSGLVRSNTVLSREAFECRNVAAERDVNEIVKPNPQILTARHEIQRNPSEESESFDEEKLNLDRSTSEKSAKHQHFRDINTCSSKTSSPGSSLMSSWCNAAGESLAIKDCSSLSITSSEDSNRLQEQLKLEKKIAELTLELNDDDDDEMSAQNTDMQISTISSITETGPLEQTLNIHVVDLPEIKQKNENTTKSENIADGKADRPKSIYNTLNESKFAEMALASSEYLLDDETSPTDSLVSSTESEEAGAAAGSKQKKHRLNAELQERDIDEISPELEVCSPISPGTPTHASHSLSLSDCGNLIDDEIADQPALLFNNDAREDGGESCTVSHHLDQTDTPTLMETANTGSMRSSLKSHSKARTALQQAIELSLRTPMSLRKAVMERAESLDTLSPCESICSDDLMMDFDINSSMDSIDRSIKSRSGSDLNKIDGDTELFSEFDRKGSNVMKELSSILRVHSNRNVDKDNVIAHLPARATRLLNRSRLQQQQQCPLNNAVNAVAGAADSDSSKSAHSVRRSAASASTASSNASPLQRSLQFQQQRDSHSSSDDLMLYDKSFRNAMIQDVLQFKKQLLRLRRILQEDEDYLTRTETLNPFENDNGQLFASCGLDSKLLDDIDLASLTSSTTDDPMQELADLRRQVVYLQGQVDDRDRTIRLQRNLIEKLEAEKSSTAPMPMSTNFDGTKECISMATQTERTRPLSLGPDGLSRSKPEYTSYTTHFPAICSDSTTIIKHQQQYPPSGGNNNATTNQTRRHTIISTTLTNYNHQLAAHAPRRASIAWEKPTPDGLIPTATYKPVRITLIGEPLKPLNGAIGVNGNSGMHIPMEYKKNLLNGDKDIVIGVNNGYHEAILTGGNAMKMQNYQQLESLATQSHQQHHQQHQQQQKFYQPQHMKNGNLNPTVTIV